MFIDQHVDLTELAQRISFVASLFIYEYRKCKTRAERSQVPLLPAPAEAQTQPWERATGLPLGPDGPWLSFADAPLLAAAERALADGASPDAFSAYVGLLGLDPSAFRATLSAGHWVVLRPRGGAPAHGLPGGRWPAWRGLLRAAATNGGPELEAWAHVDWQRALKGRGGDLWPLADGAPPA